MTTKLRLVARLRKSGVISPLPHTPSWQAQEQPHLNEQGTAMTTICPVCCLCTKHSKRRQSGRISPLVHPSSRCTFETTTQVSIKFGANLARGCISILVCPCPLICAHTLRVIPNLTSTRFSNNSQRLKRMVRYLFHSRYTVQCQDTGLNAHKSIRLHGVHSRIFTYLKPTTLSNIRDRRLPPRLN